jgi:hypothetical protein
MDVKEMSRYRKLRGNTLWRTRFEIGNGTIARQLTPRVSHPQNDNSFDEEISEVFKVFNILPIGLLNVCHSKIMRNSKVIFNIVFSCIPYRVRRNT